MAALHLALPSMKTAKNVDGKFKNKLPSTKTAKNVDGRGTSVFVKLLIISVFVL